MSTSGVTGGWIWAIKTCSTRENPQACLTRVFYAGYHTRWRGLESYLLPDSPPVVGGGAEPPADGGGRRHVCPDHPGHPE